MVPFLYEVNVELLHPVRAKPGDVLGVRPGHATRPVVVLRYLNGKWSPVNEGPPNYGAILGLAEDGAITQTYPAFVSLRDFAIRTA